MKKNTTKIKKLSTLAAGGALAMMLGLPVAAQPAQTEPANSPAQIDRQERQPTIRTYEKFPDPDGDDQDVEVSTYEKEPDPSGQSQDLEFVRYPEQNPANNDQVPEPEITVIESGDE